MPLFKIFGIEIRLDLSVAIIFGLIVFSLGSGVFPQWHPDWGPALVWLTAVTSGVLFFASLLAHELAHSVVSQKYGIPVPRITLFLFGGMAEVSREPDTAKVEFFVAIAGRLMSIRDPDFGILISGHPLTLNSGYPLILSHKTWRH